MNVNTELLYLRKPPHSLPDYPTLEVKVIAGKKNPKEVVAFINRQLCFFEKDDPFPKVGSTVEVMITRWRWRKLPDGTYDMSKPLAYMLRVADLERFVKVRHYGFECAGSMCATTASVDDLPDSNGKSRRTWVTPGRTGIFQADNVNAGYTWKQEYAALRPGFIWVDKKRYDARLSPLRCEGMARVEDHASFYEGETK